MTVELRTGLITLIIGEFGNFAAYGFAPATMVAPLGAVSIISNLVYAHFIRKEHVRMRDVLGSFFIVSGGAVLVIFSPHVLSIFWSLSTHFLRQNEVILDIKELLEYIMSPVFEIYSGILLLIYILLHAAGKKLVRGPGYCLKNEQVT